MKNNHIENLKNRAKKLQLNVEFIDHKPITDFKSFTSVIKYLGIRLDHCIPTLIFRSEIGYFAIYKLADSKVNMKKLRKALGVADVRMATPDELKHEFGFTPGGVGIYHPKLKYYIDNQVSLKEKVFTS